MAALLAGLPQSVPGCTVNRLCASGLEAINISARAILSGEGDVFVAGGVESMSRKRLTPLPKAENGFSFGNLVAFDTAWAGAILIPLGKTFPLLHGRNGRERSPEA